MEKRRSEGSRWLKLALVAILAITTLSSNGQTVEKVIDLNFGNVEGVGFGGYYPLDRFTQVGTNLWFTTSAGGTFDAGTISRFDLVTREVVQVASMDNNTGKAPEGALLVIDDEGYFTTTTGGTGNRGTISKVNLTNGVVTTIYNFITNGLPTGQTPRSGLTRIGDNLYCTASAGGSNGMGTIIRLNISSGAITAVHQFDGEATGRQPYEAFTQVGDAWYFTTFAGGTNAASGFGTGPGTLGKMTFDTSGNAVITKLLDLPINNTAFAAQNPALVGTNSLYFTTVGNNPNPGSLIRYDIDTGFWTNLFTFRTNALEQAQFGKQPGYNGLVEWQGELYFMTRQGGTSNLGVIAKFSIASNTVIKLADLDGTANLALGNATGSYGTGTIVEENERLYMYFPVSRGGANNRGTILRVVLPAPPIQLAIAPGASGNAALSWTGGYPPFTVQSRSDMASGSWTNLLEGVTDRSASVPINGEQGFFRVSGTQ